MDSTFRVILVWTKDSENFHRYEPTSSSGCTGTLYIPLGKLGTPPPQIIQLERCE